MSRMVQARMRDDQYDWLVERAMEGYEGDLSKALRGSVDFARMMLGILEASDPHEALTELLDRSRVETERMPELHMDADDEEDEIA